jgi:hypothetical protein
MLLADATESISDAPPTAPVSYRNILWQFLFSLSFVLSRLFSRPHESTLPYNGWSFLPLATTLKDSRYDFGPRQNVDVQMVRIREVVDSNRCFATVATRVSSTSAYDRLFRFQPFNYAVRKRPHVLIRLQQWKPYSLTPYPRHSVSLVFLVGVVLS